MKIVLLHYHLDHGGVTQVMLNHLCALATTVGPDERLEVILLSGSQEPNVSRVPLSRIEGLEPTVVAVPALAYDRGLQPRAEALEGDLLHVLSTLRVSPDSSVIHVHNHALGNNLSLPGAIARLASSGYRFLLQVHDFAEDFRPWSYARWLDAFGSSRGSSLGELLYPQRENIHYAVLNRRDQAVLARAGVSPERLHRLPNPVIAPGPLPTREDARRRLEACFGVPNSRPLLLYPVRGIRRKNLGEALLWSALAKGELSVGLTLRPANPLERHGYLVWQMLADELNLPCFFRLGASGGLPLADNLSGADAILTTSVAEGFGMAFAESWLVDRALVGRDLPEVTRDLVDVGLNLNALQSGLHVPGSVFAAGEVQAALEAEYGRVLSAYRRPRLRSTLCVDDFAVGADPSTVDFGVLTPGLQARVISDVWGSGALRDEIRRLNPKVGAVPEWSEDTLSVIRANAGAVRSSLALSVCGARLRGIYDALLQGGARAVDECVDADVLLDSFLNPVRFRPVCTVES